MDTPSPANDSRDRSGHAHRYLRRPRRLVALGLDASRRQYALDLSDRFVDLAAVLMGSPRKPVDPDRLSNTPTDDLRGRLPRGRTALAAERQLGAVPSE